MTKLHGPALLAIGVAIGVGVSGLLVWNPMGWGRIDHLVGRHSDMAPATDGMTAAQPTQTERKVLYWRAPMDPNYTSDQPGKSPMGMDLVPVYEDEVATEGGVRVSPDFVQNFGVRTTEVRRGSLPIEIRTVGELAHNEESVVSISTKFEGWIEKAYVSNVGEQISKGDLLFEIYSPQLVTTQQEYLAALAYAERLANAGAYPDALERAQSLLRAAESRLGYWDVSAQQIAALRESREAKRTVSFFSPAQGYVVSKMGDSFEGMRVAPGMPLLKLADHSTLWVEAQFYEEDMRFLREGQRVTVETDAFPGRSWSGTIRLLRPALDPKTRTLTALVAVQNRDLVLRPNMYANIAVRAGGAADAVLVPAQAVLHSGQRAVVIVAKGGGLFEPREVQLGIASGDMQQVVKGLTPGEQVVTSSQFLIDSESNLKAAIAQLLGDRTGSSEESDAMPMDHQH